MLRKSLGPLFALAVIALVIVSFAKPNDGSDRVLLAGSTTVLRIAEVAAEMHNATDSGVNVLVQGGGSSAGIEAAVNGSANIGMSSRELKPEEKKLGLTDIPIAIDAIAIIINPKNSVEKLTKEQVKKIYAGEITNWHEIGGEDEKIILVNRDEASGTREAFAKKIMGKTPFARDAVIQPGSGQVRSIVSTTPGAVGYISLGYITKDVKTVALDGIRPTVKSIADKKYALMRTLHFLVKGEPDEQEKAFIDYMLGDKIQRDVVSKEFLQIKVVTEKQ